MATDYDRACEAMVKENAQLLEDFTGWLQAQGLSEATVRRHFSNIDLYINHYLLYEQVTAPEDGCHDVGGYLGFWFIRKVWASEYTTRSNAASLRKFYGFMVERGHVDPEDLAYLKERIRDGMPGYLARVRRYNDPSITDPAEVWDL